MYKYTRSKNKKKRDKKIWTFGQIKIDRLFDYRSFVRFSNDSFFGYGKFIIIIYFFFKEGYNFERKCKIFFNKQNIVKIIIIILMRDWGNNELYWEKIEYRKKKANLF